MQAYEDALLLSSYAPLTHQGPAQARVKVLDELLDSLVNKSQYCAVVQRYQRHFHFSLSRGLSITYNENAPLELDAAKKLELLVCGVAALQAFVQANWTGPAVEVEVKDIFQVADESTDQNGASTSTDSGHTAWTEEVINARCIEDLSMAGEPAYHLIRKAGYLLLARRIFELPLFDSQPAVPSIAIWRMRAGLVNLRLLDVPVSLPEKLVMTVDQYTKALPQASPTQADLKASMLLLQGVYHAQFVHVSSSATKTSNDYFYQAAQCAKLQYELTGRMGKRTKWQIDEKSQLVVLAKSRNDRDDGWEPRQKMSLEPATHAPANGTSEDNGVAISLAVPPINDQAAGTNIEQPRALALNDDTLLERTHFTSSAGGESSQDDALHTIDPNHQPILHPLDECILLALSLVITNTSPTHGLTTLQIQSFVARILEDGSQNWSIFSMGLLLRSRLEANRSRTVERGLLQIQSLVDQLKLESVSKPRGENDLDLEQGASPQERLKYFYQLSLPSIWELEKELATRFLGLGVIRSALEIFSRMEMWEEVARCHSALEEEDKAIRIVEDLLDERLLESESTMTSRRTAANGSDSTTSQSSRTKLGRGQKAKLWCLLGDLKKDPELYRKAWEVSEKTSSRAMQSLGKSYFLKGEFADARDCLSKALAINPLNGKMWFILGCAAMRIEDWETAENAFRRCTAIDDDDGESWNNLATVILKQAERDSTAARAAARQPTDDLAEETADAKDQQYERKRLAFTCLRQAIKYAYDSWRIWANYLLVSVDVGEFMEVCRAMGRLAELRAEKDGTAAVDLDVLDKLVQIVARDVSSVKTGDSAVASSTEDTETHRGLAGRVKSLFENALLPRITDSARLYTSYARLLFTLGDLQGAIQAHLKAYRVEVVQNDLVSTSKPEFEKAATRVHETVDILRNLGDRSVGGQVVMPAWKTQARSMVRTFLGRTKGEFGEEVEWEQLQQELQELKV